MRDPQQARFGDYLYCPDYTLSSGKDHERAQQQAAMVQVKKLPYYRNMFADGRNYPRHSYQVRVNSMIPRHMLEPQANPLGLPDVAKPTVGTAGLSDAHLIAANHHKFFRRPIIPQLGAGDPVEPSAVLAGGDRSGRPIARPHVADEGARRAAAAAAAAGVDDETAQKRVLDAMRDVALATTAAPPTNGRARTIATQSDFRESETQTDPYTPDYVLVGPPGQSEPELLALATLSYGHGLPATMAEVEMIDRARQRRSFERSLPDMSDPANYAKRRKMMEQQELREWAERERQINEIQEARLRILKNVLQDRVNQHHELAETRLSALHTRLQEQKEQDLAKIQQKRIKTLRKLSDKRKTVEGRPLHRDIISEYAHYGSKVYAPHTRDGRFPDSSLAQHSTDLEAETENLLDLRTVDGLSQLEAMFERRHATAKPVSAHSRNSGGSTRSSGTLAPGPMVAPRTRREREIIAHLERLDANFRSAKEPAVPQIPACLAHKIERPPPRPPTPSAVAEDISLALSIEAGATALLAAPSTTQDDIELATIFLQSVLRGRAAQNKMFLGKEKRLELINELRTFETIKRVDEETAWRQDEQRFRAHQTRLVDATLGGIEGEIVAQTLDFLSNELVRRREEQRIAALVSMAERARRMREAEESGKRQAEEVLRQQLDQQFREMVGTHHETVDSYLDDILGSSVENTAASTAHLEARVRAEKLNDIVDDLEANKPEDTVKDLIASFLIPEVDRDAVRHQVHLRQQRYRRAAAAALGRGKQL